MCEICLNSLYTLFFKYSLSCKITIHKSSLGKKAVGWFHCFFFPPRIKVSTTWLMNLILKIGQLSFIHEVSKRRIQNGWYSYYYSIQSILFMYTIGKSIFFLLSISDSCWWVDLWFEVGFVGAVFFIWIRYYESYLCLHFLVWYLDGLLYYLLDTVLVFTLLQSATLFMPCINQGLPM